MRDAGVDIAGGNNEPGLGGVSPERSPRKSTGGTPTAMTGTPMVRWSKAVRVLPMPLPDDPSVG